MRSVRALEIAPTVEQVRALSRAARFNGEKVGLVPTMGALHEGHVSLVRAALAECDLVAVSIFVNPTQFGANEDFAKYPRNLERDCELLEREGVQLVFAPSTEQMYPQENVTWIEVKALSGRLCGKSRPGHFRGVATVVAKLFHIIEPDVAFFGQKDAAQVAVIRRMVQDLNFPLTIEVCPIVREPDGLALSSRNAYLNPEERKSALILYQSLMRVKALFEAGELDSAKLIASAGQEFSREPGVKLEYFEIVDPDTLEVRPTIRERVLVAVAATIGSTRLIDNVLLEP
jgi:pantoate--beta-alanine ligase